MRFKYYSENLNLATADRCAQDYINGATSYNIFIHVQWSYLHIAKRTSHEKILQHINHLFKNFNFGTKLRDRKVLHTKLKTGIYNQERRCKIDAVAAAAAAVAAAVASVAAANAIYLPRGGNNGPSGPMGMSGPMGGPPGMGGMMPMNMGGPPMGMPGHPQMQSGPMQQQQQGPMGPGGMGPGSMGPGGPGGMGPGSVGMSMSGGPIPQGIPGYVRMQSPPPPGHQTQRTASVPGTMTSPGPGPGSPSDSAGQSTPSPPAASGLNSPADGQRGDNQQQRGLPKS